MTRRRDPAAESLILSAPSAREGAEAAGTSRAAASQTRTAAGIPSPIGRPRAATSTRSLQALGARVVEIATARHVAPDALLDRATAVVNAGCAMVGCDRAATHAGYTRHGDTIEALLTCEGHAERGAVEI